MLRIPVYAKGGVVATFALIDDADADAVKAHRWCFSTAGYARTWVRGDKPVELYLHRLVLGLERGDGRLGDHINGDKLDNRRSNLRIATRQQNAQNRRCAPNVTSRHRGVGWNRRCGKWQVQVQVNGRAHYLGLFSDELDAARAASAFRREHMPFAYEEAT